MKKKHILTTFSYSKLTMTTATTTTTKMKQKNKNCCLQHSKFVAIVVVMPLSQIP